MKKFILFIVIISLLALWPFFKGGFFTSHDGEWMIIRFSAFHQTLKTGQFPVRFVDRLNNNYGYPVINFLYPAPFYFSEIFKLFKINFVNSIKITFVISAIVSSAGMFWALSQKFSKYASLAGAIIFLYAPYRFVDLYVRGSIGENMAFAFIPLILGSIFQIEKENKVYLPIISFSIAILILSHNVIAAIFLPIIIVIVLISKIENIKEALFYIMFGILISSFFWIPALFDLQYVKLSQINVVNPQEHLVNLSKLISTKWGYGPLPTNIDGFSTQIGISSAIILFTSIIMLFKKQTKNYLEYLCLILALVSIFFITKYSSIFWHTLPIVGIIQFPWRLLSVVVFSTSILTAILLEKLKNKIFWASVIILITISSTIIYTNPLSFVNRGDDFYSTNEDTTTVKDEYLPIWVVQKPQERANNKLVVNKEVQTQNLIIKPSLYQATLISNVKTDVTINTIYFPGHKVIINGHQTSINYKNQYGLINFALPMGRSEVIIKYEKTPVHLFSEILSILFLMITGRLLYISWQKQKS